MLLACRDSPLLSSGPRLRRLRRRHVEVACGRDGAGAGVAEAQQQVHRLRGGGGKDGERGWGTEGEEKDGFDIRACVRGRKQVRPVSRLATDRIPVGARLPGPARTFFTYDGWVPLANDVSILFRRPSKLWHRIRSVLNC